MEGRVICMINQNCDIYDKTTATQEIYVNFRRRALMKTKNIELLCNAVKC